MQICAIHTYIDRSMNKRRTISWIINISNVLILSQGKYIEMIFRIGIKLTCLTSLFDLYFVSYLTFNMQRARSQREKM